MMKKITLSLFLILLIPALLQSQKPLVQEFRSPGGDVILKIEAGANLIWSVTSGGKQIIEPSEISMTLQGGEVLGTNARPSSPKIEKINTSFNALNYRKNVINDVCTQVTLNFRSNYGVIFRIYDDAVAYRFFTRRPGELTIMNEVANFNFSQDYKTFVPIQWDYRDRQNFNSSFEALYREINFSRFPKDSLAFLPVLVDIGDNMKVTIFEIDLEDYPGLYLDLNQTGKGFKGVNAPYPLETYTKSLNIIPSKRADYIAKTTGNRSFPWRAVVISKHDRDLLDCDIVQKLASPPRFDDFSWIRAGQVAWDWWNSNNISHVDFRAGMNTPTYKYYIDFAEKYKIPYILIDAGWNVAGDLTRPKPDMNLEEIVSYGNSKGVGVWVWCSWKDVLLQMDESFRYFAKTGIKGLKIDFFDRDDQLVVASTYEIAKRAADMKLMLDYHGIYKPTGLQRTYPNVVGIEGVKGGENYKWANEDQPRYCVTIPFIRNQAGPMDYTSGAMRNSNQQNYRAIDDMPMSKGTRVNQLAHYIVFEVPIQMLSDNPTAYMKEQECTEFITKIPTTWEATVPLDGKVAEFVSIARRRGDTWFAAAMTNWTPRELTMDLSFLGEGTYRAEIFSDGVNADRDATDYRKKVLDVTGKDRLNIKLMNGGGWAARFERK